MPNSKPKTGEWDEYVAKPVKIKAALSLADQTVMTPHGPAEALAGDFIAEDPIPGYHYPIRTEVFRHKYVRTKDVVEEAPRSKVYRCPQCNADMQRTAEKLDDDRDDPGS